MLVYQRVIAIKIFIALEFLRPRSCERLFEMIEKCLLVDAARKDG